jgi:hypothetical protein
MKIPRMAPTNPIIATMLFITCSGSARARSRLEFHCIPVAVKRCTTRLGDAF